jgi:hypothetical protein
MSDPISKRITLINVSKWLNLNRESIAAGSWIDASLMAGPKNFPTVSTKFFQIMVASPDDCPISSCEVVVLPSISVSAGTDTERIKVCCTARHWGILYALFKSSEMDSF